MQGGSSKRSLSKPGGNSGMINVNSNESLGMQHMPSGSQHLQGKCDDVDLGQCAVDRSIIKKSFLSANSKSIIYFISLFTYFT